MAPEVEGKQAGRVNVSQAEGDAGEGFIALFLLGIGAAWLAFLLLAPFGVLCAIGAGKCGTK